ncbi:hypothetical protein FOZ63_004086 [Perkinsus olseni]|uniref:C3H1-type domain-containing protein n=1 Tax=Perkinsus olseni TaxID=32597 RepID=A0A7J6R5R1_PEROL|nr:hypothetical protein FOZ63_004086 [Perkinsus olseni]
MALPAILSNEDIAKFRTSTCERFATTGECLFSSRCQYSHNIEWRRRSPLKYRYEPRLCDRYADAICYIMMDTDPADRLDSRTQQQQQPPRRMRCRCPQGRSCRMAHSEEEVLFHPWVYKAMLCEDVCCTRYYCPFAHSPEEIRASPLSNHLVYRILPYPFMLGQDQLRECLAPFLERVPSFATDDESPTDDGGNDGSSNDGANSGTGSLDDVVDSIAAAAAAVSSTRGRVPMSPSTTSTFNEGGSSRGSSEQEAEWADVIADGRVRVSSSSSTLASGTRRIYRAQEETTMDGTSEGSHGDAPGNRLRSRQQQQHHHYRPCLAKIIPLEGPDERRDAEAFMEQSCVLLTLTPPLTQVVLSRSLCMVMGGQVYDR